MIDTTHITIGVIDRSPIFRDPKTVQRAVRVLVRAAAAQLVVFNLVDDHIHLFLLGDEHQALACAKRVAAALERALGVGFDPPRATEHRDEGHARSNVRYILTQHENHGLPIDDALWPGSALPDLLGLRRLSGFEPDVSGVLSWYRPRHALAAVHLDDLAFAPVEAAARWGRGMAEVVETAAFVCGADLDADGRANGAVRARRVIVDLGREAGCTGAQLHRAAGLSASAISRSKPADPRDVKATLRRMAFVEAVRARRAEQWIAGEGRPAGRTRGE